MYTHRGVYLNARNIIIVFITLITFAIFIALLNAGITGKFSVVREKYHQDYPFERLVDQVVPNRKASRNPLFDVVFSYNSKEDRMLRKNDSYQREVKGKSKFPLKSKFDLVLLGSESPEGINLSFFYQTGLFKKDTILRFIKYFKEIVALVIENNDIYL